VEISKKMIDYYFTQIPRDGNMKIHIFTTCCKHDSLIISWVTITDILFEKNKQYGLLEQLHKCLLGMCPEIFIKSSQSGARVPPRLVTWAEKYPHFPPSK